MKKEEPIFKSIFGESWGDLPPVMRKHYANRPYSTDVMIVEGRLDVMCKWFAKPLFWLSRTAPARNVNNVLVRVEFHSAISHAGFGFYRIFRFAAARDFIFRTTMYHYKHNEVMEHLSGRLCWHIAYEWTAQKVHLHHKGYALFIAGRYIKLPIEWLIGHSDAQEWAVGDNRFGMCATVRHPLIGKLYEYKGEFEIIGAQDG